MAANALNVNTLNGLVASYKANEDYIENKPDTWVLPNRVKFNSWIEENFVYKTPSHKEDLFPSQRFVKDFIQYDSCYRGILLYHGLGLGKTKASILVAEVLLPYMDVEVFLPASLRTNFIEEIKHKGANHFFSTKQHWTFIPQRKLAGNVLDLVKTKLFVDSKTIKKHKGVYVPEKDKPVNWDTLNSDQKQEIDFQLTTMIMNKYKFTNYNGLQHSTLKSKKDAYKDGRNPYDNKVIIIDEVHNFISRSLKDSSVCHSLYEMFYFAKNAKFILLTGTPIINYPRELAYLINLLRGPQYVYTLHFKDDTFDTTKIDKALSQNSYIDHYEISRVQKKVLLEFLPPYFRFQDKSNCLVKRESIEKTPEQLFKELKKTLPFTKDVTKEDYPLFPSKDDDFNAKYIDAEKGNVKNERLMMRRLAGCISYFGTYFGDKYPSQKILEPIELPMSNEQYLVYEKQRLKEIAKEMKAIKFNKKKKDDLFEKKNESYRTFSRMICNFAFPESIVRPYPNDGRLFHNELDKTNEEDEEVQEQKTEAGVPKDKGRKKTKKDGDKDDDEQESKKEKYFADIEKALQDLKDHPEFLRGDELKKYSPKFAKLLENIPKIDGKILVYSQFRMLEGLGIFCLVLEANGWAELKILKKRGGGMVLDLPKTGIDEWLKKPKFFQYYTGEDNVKMQMNIFNNNDIKTIFENILPEDAPPRVRSHFLNGTNMRGELLKLMMITQSGAEGLSLKHVRQVHVMEPYWNDVRISQVIGRAVRANSHQELEEHEKNVTVYKYLTVFNKGNKGKINKTLENQDKLKTTDEYIYQVAERKARIIGKLQDLMKASAVDCRVHKEKRGSSIKCLSFPENLSPCSLSYVWEDAKEETNAEYKQKVRTKVVKKVEGRFRQCNIDGSDYAFNLQNNIFYDLDKYQEGFLIPRARLVKLEDGKYRFERL